MKRVKATRESMMSNIKIKELGRIAAPGEVFDVSNMRYVTLTGRNMYHKVFVSLVEDLDATEEIVEEHIDDVPVRKSSRKKKNG